jgi:hypothetical protein
MAKRRGWIISASVLREAIKLADEVSAWIAARDAAGRQASASKLEAIKLADQVSAWIAARDAAWRRASASMLARPKGR